MTTEYLYNPTTVYIDPTGDGANFLEYTHETHKMHPYPQFIVDSSEIDPSVDPDPPYDPSGDCPCKHIPSQVLIDEDENGIPDYADQLIEDTDELRRNNTWVTI